MGQIIAVTTVGLELFHFLLLTIIVGILSYVIVRFGKEVWCKLILLAMLIMIAAVGFGAFLPETATLSAEIMMKIALILALGGLGVCIWQIQCNSSKSEPKKKGGAKNEE